MNMLGRLTCPTDEVAEWVLNCLREKHHDAAFQRQQAIDSATAKLDRFKRMDGELYDDKLAGDISKERYEGKHEQFIKEIEEAEDVLIRAQKGTNALLAERILLVELSQKAAELYARKSAEHKRVIIKHLFAALAVDEDSINLEFTSFVQSLASKVRLTHKIIGVAK
ncbi:hypothetical protein IPG36_05405 [bacterium]|nr:MAG: hypothetical protein IPG36_05405 [bacterium]